MTTSGEFNNSGNYVKIDQQAQNIYNLASDASPEARFDMGILHLKGGMPEKARELIREAVDRGHATPKTHFYLLLALLNGRTLQELPREDFDRLQKIVFTAASWPDNEWVAAIRLIGDLPNFFVDSATDAEIFNKRMNELGDTQAELIYQHLEAFLEGSILDQAWERAVQQAKDCQSDGNRAERVWKFFQPEPARARVCPPNPIQIEIVDCVRAIAGSVVFAASFITIALTALMRNG
ncbi:MAG: hypothetical protein HOQ05_08050, partial [Corynebacteriales bacterium]|nr:hypothetical protein [Mycobacteriales bacterium]